MRSERAQDRLQPLDGRRDCTGARDLGTDPLMGGPCDLETGDSIRARIKAPHPAGAAYHAPFEPEPDTP